MSPTTRYRGRFAPSPTGPLHLGSLVAALGSWLVARQADGEWWVRIEDLDPPREVPGAADQQLECLKGFGLWPDGPVVRQSERHERYAAALHTLIDQGHAFACRCSRRDLEATDGRHLGPCIRDDPLRSTAIRLRVPDAVIGFDDGIQGRFEQMMRRDVGDVVLRRADGYWAYQLAVVVDDAAQGITDVVRGADLLDSTPRQIWLQRCLNLPTPTYAHLPLVRDGSGRKLSKSLASLPVDPDNPIPALREAWRLLGQSEPPMLGVVTPESWLLRALMVFDAQQIPSNTGTGQ